jgi:AbrB family looped-hinge helix DNA binding protein
MRNLDKEFVLVIVRTVAKVTSKLQLTIPKAIAERYGIRAGDEVDLTPAGEVIRMSPGKRHGGGESIEERLRLFDQAVERQCRRQAKLRRVRQTVDRGWRREDLYIRGLAR